VDNICLLWDFDNTLAYRNGMWTQSVSNVLNRNGYYDFDREIISQSLRKGYPWNRHEEAHSDYFGDLSWWEYINSLIVKALEEVGMNDAKENARIASQFKDEYLRLDAWEIYGETKRNLERSLKSGYTNIILSNHVPELGDLVSGLGIDKYFRAQITSALVGYDKPNPK
jgi:putative hydrolase of the HAD superfamily